MKVKLLLFLLHAFVGSLANELGMKKSSLGSNKKERSELQDDDTGIIVGDHEEEDSDDDIQVEMDDPIEHSEPNLSDSRLAEKDIDEDDVLPLKPSPDIDTYFLFVKPAGAHTELPAGKDVHFLVGITNKGAQDFVVDSLDASFRYPMDFSFYIQNFSTLVYNRAVRPKQQITLFYTFYTSETFSSRPFGLTVNLMYRDMEGTFFMDAVFNETVNIVELDEGLDGETFFLYMFLAACGVLLLVAGQQFIVSFGRRRPVSKQKIEIGTQNPNDVDYDWLPKETLNEINKSPRSSPRQSPRQRRVKRNAGSGEE